MSTFEDAAHQFITTHRSAWRSRKHATEWRRSLDHYTEPLSDRPCADITINDVLGVVQPLWQVHPVTAERLRARIELVLAFQAVREGRATPNPARWRGCLSAVLPKVPHPIHLRALPWAEMPALVARFDLNQTADRALLFTITTVARRSEVLQATRDQFDGWGRVWYLPAASTKAFEARRIPLHPAIVPWLTRGTLFPIGECAMLTRLKELAPGVTLHGMRSTFATWAQEAASAPLELIATALGHVARGSTSRYARSDLLGRRIPLMEGWGDFCLSKETAA